MRDNLPSAIISSLEHIEDFSLGKVFLYSKPRLFRRKHHLHFTGRNIKELLVPANEEMPIRTERRDVYYLGECMCSTNSNTEFECRAEIKGGPAAGTASAGITLTSEKSCKVKLGQITPVVSDLVNSFTSGKIHFNTDHLVVQMALKRGKTVFIINKIYEAQSCNVSTDESKMNCGDFHAAANVSGGAVFGGAVPGEAEVRIGALKVGRTFMMKGMMNEKKS